MPTFFRYIFAGVLAIAITLGLFLLMNYLISAGDGKPPDRDASSAIRFGDVKVDETLDVRRRVPPPPPPPPKEPPPPNLKIAQDVNAPRSPLPDIDMPDLDIGIGGIGPGLAFGMGDPSAMAGEGDIIPLVRISPQFPRRAALARIEGWVEVEFTITETGTVDSPRVIRSQPPRVFDREAIRAILRWKFKPRVVDGRPVPRVATQTIDFKFDEN